MNGGMEGVSVMIFVIFVIQFIGNFIKIQMIVGQIVVGIIGDKIGVFGDDFGVLKKDVVCVNVGIEFLVIVQLGFEFFVILGSWVCNYGFNI